MKNLTCVFIGITISLSSGAQILSQGAFHPTSFTTVTIPGSSRNWSTISNAAPSDDNYTSFGNLPASTSGSFTDYLVVTGFGFSIPSGVTIVGIEAEVERSDPNQRTTDYRVRIVKGGSIGSSDRSTGLAYPATDAYRLYGSNADLWGQSWTEADINSPHFGLAIAAQRTFTNGNTAGSIDDIRITVYYTNNITILPATLTKFTAQPVQGSVWVNWETSHETQMDDYTVERSADGNHFTSIGTVTSSNMINAVSAYSFTDLQPLNGITYYRLRMNSISGEIKYSGIVQVNRKQKGSSQLYPTLVKPGEMLFIKGNAADGHEVRFFTASGQMAGRTVLQGSSLSSSFLNGKKGVLYYTITGKQNESLGSGQLILQ